MSEIEAPVAAASLHLVALGGIPLVQEGDDLVELLGAALDRAGIRPQPQDVLVVAQKIVSKAEGRFVDPATVHPSAEARRIAAEADKDPAIVEIILSESRRVVRVRRNLIIAEHRLGYVMANAGIDQSNVDGGRVLLLPLDPDGTARSLRDGLAARVGTAPAIIINDSFGRPWRQGVCGVALGCAGLPSLVDRRGAPDLFGRPLEVTTIGFADEISAAASLLMGQADEGRPAVLVRGLTWSSPPSGALELVRPAGEDLFR